MCNEVVRFMATICCLVAFACSSVGAKEADQLGGSYYGLTRDYQQGTRFGWVPEAINEHSVIEDTAPRGYLPEPGTNEAEHRESLRRAYTGEFGRTSPYAVLAEADLQETRTDGTCTVADCEFPERIHERGDCHRNFCIMISASWCGPCKKMYPLILSLRKQGYIVYVFDIESDEFKDYDAKFDVKAVPTFIVFDGGKEVTRTVGKTKEDWFHKNLKTRKVQEEEELNEHPYDGL